MIVVVSSAVIKRGDAFLFVKEFKPSAVNKYGLPSGKLEDGESVINCVYREVQEETGFSVTSAELLQVVNKPHTREGNTVVKFVFACEISDDQVSLPEHECEFLSMPTIRAKAASGLIRGDEIVPMLESFDSGTKNTQVLQIMA